MLRKLHDFGKKKSQKCRTLSPIFVCVGQWRRISAILFHRMFYSSQAWKVPIAFKMIVSQSKQCEAPINADEWWQYERDQIKRKNNFIGVKTKLILLVVMLVLKARWARVPISHGAYVCNTVAFHILTQLNILRIDWVELMCSISTCDSLYSFVHSFSVISYFMQ